MSKQRFLCGINRDSKKALLALSGQRMALDSNSICMKCLTAVGHVLVHFCYICAQGSRNKMSCFSM